MDKKTAFSKGQGFRHGIQSLWTLITNSYLVGFAQGKIYQGSLKHLCVPGMNCYSCPGARGACPIGALQAVIGSGKYHVAWYLAGFFLFVGGLMGRFVCGWLCPFGLIQELLHKIPFPKKTKSFPADRLLRKAKYLFLLVFVILMPMFLVDLLGQGAPYFCKFICPVGTLEGGIPLVLRNKTIRGAVGWLYTWKVAILIGTVVLAVMVYRPFCKYICPLGGIYALFNPIAMFRYRVEEDRCVGCGACKKACPMGCDPVKNPNDLECIRCGICKKTCPTEAICSGFSQKSGTNPKTEKYDKTE